MSLPSTLDTMLDMTAATSVNGVKFDGVDLFLSDPHTSIDASEDDLKRLADGVGRRGLVVGSLVAPVWPPTGGGSAMGDEADRKKFLTQVQKACAIGRTLRDLGIRKYGVIRIDSSASPGDWAKDPAGNTKRIAETFRQAADIAEAHGERLAAEGEICWGGMHSWKRMVELLEAVGRPKTVGMQTDMAHTLLFLLGANAPEDRLLPANYDWSDPGVLDEALPEDDARAAAMDDRLPYRPERCDGQGLRLTRQDRPSLPPARPQRQARHRQARRLLAARRQRCRRLTPSSTSAGTAACSRTPS